MHKNINEIKKLESPPQVIKKLFDKNDKEVVRFSKMETENDLVKRSFVQSFLESVRSKMYGNRKSSN